MRQINHNLFFLLILSVLWLGCKTTRRTPVKLPEKSKMEIYQVLQDHNIDFEWFSAKADANISSSSLSGSGDLRLRIRKDSLVWMIGKKLSIEGVRAKITPVEFATIYRQDNSYQKEPFHYLSHLAGFEINFSDLQELAIGNIFLPDTSNIDSLDQTMEHYTLYSEIDGFKVKYYVDPFAMQLDRVILKDPKDQQLTITYSDYKNLDVDRELAHRLSLTFESSEESAKCILKFKDVELDVVKRTPFKIPSHYTRIY